MTSRGTTADRPRLHIGLTGGIASGKSTVAAELADLGAVVVDSDALARAVVAPGSEGLALVREAFGPASIAADGTMDRAAVAAMVFHDADARERLNGIIHPLVRAEGRRLVREAGPDAVVVQDVPLLVETGQAGAYDLVLVVQADTDERVARMVRDRGWTRSDTATSRPPRCAGSPTGPAPRFLTGCGRGGRSCDSAVPRSRAASRYGRTPTTAAIRG